VGGIALNFTFCPLYSWHDQEGSIAADLYSEGSGFTSRLNHRLTSRFDDLTEPLRADAVLQTTPSYRISDSLFTPRLLVRLVHGAKDAFACGEGALGTHGVGPRQLDDKVKSKTD
jgi:hypothetical protein